MEITECQSGVKQSRRHPWFAAFFGFGATMCALTTFLLLFPGTTLDSLWRLNSNAQTAFQSLGKLSIAVMLSVGAACAFAAVGLWKGTMWGKRLAIAILSVNILGDLISVAARSDYRALIGLPIGGFMIFYLLRSCR